ncbi:MAG TPA: cytochrome c oxidase subunit 3 family protein [Pyrinomonadaceae bacterium]|nr:cytochrome c oxidase subunit 3 family protein [Pyrinomonadaceae bacterium]
MATHAETIERHGHGEGGHHGPESAHEALQHHFDNLEQQRESTTLGMWVFIAQEVMFFGGIFLAYLIYRMKYPEAWMAASNHLDWKLGTFNTVVLIGSSLTMAMAVWATQAGRDRKVQVGFMAATMLLGMVFLGVKVVEYTSKYNDGLIPIAGWFNPDAGLLAEWARAGVTVQNVQMFYWIYFAMTGLHALHMIIGIGILLPIMWAAWRRRYSPEYHAPVELFGLYWHFVDIVWIFLFPLLYLLGAHFHGGGH